MNFWNINATWGQFLLNFQDFRAVPPWLTVWILFVRGFQSYGNSNLEGAFPQIFRAPSSKTIRRMKNIFKVQEWYRPPLTTMQSMAGLGLRCLPRLLGEKVYVFCSFVITVLNSRACANEFVIKAFEYTECGSWKCITLTLKGDTMN